MTARRLPPSKACVRKMRSSHTIGVELPGPGKGTFQRTFSVALHRRGKPRSSDTPVPCGPRQAGQLA